MNRLCTARCSYAIKNLFLLSMLRFITDSSGTPLFRKSNLHSCRQLHPLQMISVAIINTLEAKVGFPLAHDQKKKINQMPSKQSPPSPKQQPCLPLLSFSNTPSPFEKQQILLLRMDLISPELQKQKESCPERKEQIQASGWSSCNAYSAG